MRISTETEGHLLEAVKLAYRKHHLGDDTIGWEELGSALLDSLCFAMGEEGYLEWKDGLRRDKWKA